jgi:hypothetical protein
MDITDKIGLRNLKNEYHGLRDLKRNQLDPTCIL